MNYPLPPEPAPNEPLRAIWGTQLIRWARANTLLPSPGMLLSRTPSGTSYRPQAAPAPAGTAAAAPYPWQPYLSVWTGDGPDPKDAADRGVSYKLQRGKFAGLTPSNIMVEFEAFGDITDTEIEEDDAVYTQIYLTVTVSESSLGQGDVSYGTPSINSIEGDDLVAALTASDTPIPDFGADGSLPAYIVVPICEIANWGGALHFPPGVNTYLDASLNVTSLNCEYQTRDFFIVY